MQIESITGARAAPTPPWIQGGFAGAGHEAPARRGERELTRCLAYMLDEIDYGVLLVNAVGQVLYLNHTARLELDRDHPLQMRGHALAPAVPAEALLLEEALADARRGRRGLLTLGSGEHRVGISVVPLAEAEAGSGLAVLMLGKRQVCEQLSVRGYARAMGLTPAETRVLEQLCDGMQPTAIARRQGVAVSTVRTQIGSIRAKTGAESIRDLVRQVAVLPPMVSSLRAAA